ncbi:MAG: uncharacterized protein HW421_3242 [Ignavibacteria bacterium]|nr:uncharacterized protein [Ignavibacteria bacterium]
MYIIEFIKKIINVTPLDNYKLELIFENESISTIIDILSFIDKGIALELKNPAFFKQVSIESGGGIVWPNGYDFCPNFLYELLNRTKI